VEGLYQRLDTAAEILREAKGDQAKAISDLKALYQKHANEIMDNREAVVKIVSDFSKEQSQEHVEKLKKARAELENLARGYSDPKAILQLLAWLN
jgi:predicted SnoaL-like aldol condensation-catalyzing enzyme